MSDIPLRFFLVVDARSREVLAWVDQDTENPHEIAQRLARQDPAAIVVVMEPKDAYRSGERPIEKVYLRWPGDDAKAALPAPPLAERLAGEGL